MGREGRASRNWAEVVELRSARRGGLEEGRRGIYLEGF